MSSLDIRSLHEGICGSLSPIPFFHRLLQHFVEIVIMGDHLSIHLPDERLRLPILLEDNNECVRKLFPHSRS